MRHREAWKQPARRCDPVRFSVVVILSIFAAACAPPLRIVALGDVHGDLAATRSALRLGGAIDEGRRPSVWFVRAAAVFLATARGCGACGDRAGREHCCHSGPGIGGQ